MSGDTLSGGTVSMPVKPDTTGFGSRLKSGIEGESAGVSGIGKKLGGAIIAGLGAAGIALGIGEFVKKGFEEYSAMDAINAQFAAGIKSTGNAANLSVKSLDDLAESVAGYSGQAVDSIGKTEQVLQTFQNIKNVGPNKIFDQATEAAANMAAKMGGDASSMALKLGRALNDPILGMSSLTRQGVTFTDQQKDQVKAMVASGNIMGAQKVILDELSVKYGGAAQAAGQTLPGALARAKVGFGELSKAAFSAIVPVLLPAVNAIASAMVKATPFVEKFAELFGSKLSAGLNAVKGPLGTLRAAFAPVLDAIGAAFKALWPSIQKLLPIAIQLATTFSPFQIVLKAIGPILPTLVSAVGKLAVALGGALMKVMTQIMPIITKVASILGGTLAKVILTLVPIITKLVGVLGPILTVVLKAVAPLITMLAKVASQLLVALMPLLKPILALITPLLQLIGPILSPLIKLVTLLIGVALKPLLQSFQLLIPIITGVVKAITDVLVPVVKTITAVLKGLTDFVTGVFTGNWKKAWNGILEIFRGVFQGQLEIAQGLVNGIVDLINGVIKGVNNVGSAVGIKIALVPHWTGSLPGLADGGTVIAGGSVLVGERGPEVLDLPAGAKVTSNKDAFKGKQITFGDIYQQAGTTIAETMQAAGFLAGQIA